MSTLIPPYSEAVSSIRQPKQQQPAVNPVQPAVIPKPQRRKQPTRQAEQAGKQAQPHLHSQKAHQAHKLTSLPAHALPNLGANRSAQPDWRSSRQASHGTSKSSKAQMHHSKTQVGHAPRPNLLPGQPHSNEQTGRFSDFAVQSQLLNAQSTWDAIDVFAKHKHDFSSKNLSTGFHRMAKHWKKLKPRERAAVLALPVTKEFIAAVLATCEQANCIGIANIAWAQGVMQIKEPRLMPEVLKRTVQLATSNMKRKFLDKELSIVIWAAAKETALPQEAWDRLSPILTAELPTYGVLSLAQSLWACATMGIQDQSFLLTAQETAISQIGKLEKQNLSMVTWAFAKLGHFDPVLTKALAERTTVVAADLSQMDLGQLCWGLCAAIDHEAKAVGVSCFRESQNSTYVRCFIAQGYRSYALRALKTQMMTLIARDAGPRGALEHMLSVGVKGFSSIGCYYPDLCDAAADSLAKRLDMGSFQAATVLLVGLKQARHYHPAFLTAFASMGLAARAPKDAAVFTPKAIATVATAMAHLTGPEGDAVCQAFVQALAERATSMIDSFDTQALCNAAWAFAVLSTLHPPFFRKLRGITPSLMSQLNATELSQLYQVNLVLRQDAPELGMETAQVQAYDDLLQTLLQSGQLTGFGRAVWQQLADPARMAPTSVYQQQIKAAVQSLQFHQEVLSEQMESEYTLDVAIPAARIAIEADGPLHFMRNRPRATGKTLVKRRSLQKLGWTVLSVPYYHWDLLPSSALQQAYMQERLWQAGLQEAATQADASSTESALTLEEKDMINGLVAESLLHGLLCDPAPVAATAQSEPTDIRPDSRSHLLEAEAADSSSHQSETQVAASSSHQLEAELGDDGSHLSEAQVVSARAQQRKNLFKSYTAGQLPRHKLLLELAVRKGPKAGECNEAK